MPRFLGHEQPRYTNRICEDTLFHYTNAPGLMGILTSGQIWSTAYYCTNDETELLTATGVLRSIFWQATSDLISKRDPRVALFHHRGVDIYEYAQNFEQQLAGTALAPIANFMTCFFRPHAEDDFLHGLLSQWRGYGPDGGYALQFSRKKLEAAIDRVAKSDSLDYDLRDVQYTLESPLKAEVLRHTDAFVRAYMSFLDEMAKPIDIRRISRPNPVADLLDGPLLAYLNFLIYTKNRHFSEERECRLTFGQMVAGKEAHIPVHYFSRGGLIVPYTRTPPSFEVLGCIDWILIGPSPRLEARIKSVSQMIRELGLNIQVRPSHIPFTRH